MKMVHMGYCRFRGTAEDLTECRYRILDNDLSDAEKDARQRLINLCVEIVEEVGYKVIGKGEK